MKISHNNQEVAVMESVVTFYHDSNIIVDKPTLEHSRKTLDFGAGFCITPNKRQVVDFAYKILLHRIGGIQERRTNHD
jgi:hypothetical protein